MTPEDRYFVYGVNASDKKTLFNLVMSETVTFDQHHHNHPGIDVQRVFLVCCTADTISQIVKRLR